MRKWIITKEGTDNFLEINDLEENILFSELHYIVENERIIWNEDYLENGYNNCFSITDCDKVQVKLTEGFSKSISTILIPGCGSNTNIQRYICEKFPNVQNIYCTDWSESAINEARNSFSSDKIHYLIEDTSKMSFQDHFFDIVILANSILSANDLLNRRMINECYRVLKKGGKLQGLFPTIFSTVEMTMLDPRIDHYIKQHKVIDLPRSSFNIDSSKHQIYYTPLRLRQILIEACFIYEKMEIFFFDSNYFVQENERAYGISKESGLLIWELFVSVIK